MLVYLCSCERETESVWKRGGLILKEEQTERQPPVWGRWGCKRDRFGGGGVVRVLGLKRRGWGGFGYDSQ